MSSIKSKDRKSLCEESMLVFVNILKLSSLSLARKTLVTTSDDDDHDDHDRNQEAVDQSAPPLVPVPQPQKSKRSQKPEQPPGSKRSYVMLPDHDHDFSAVDEEFSDYIRRFHEKAENDLQNAIVEGQTANYIKKFHRKNKSDLNNESMRRSHYVLPPPPRQAFK